MSIEELIKGKETVIKGREYLPTAKYVQPFLNKVKDIAVKYKVFVKTPDQITDGAITYNRVLIQAFTNKVIDGYTECICFTYALDTRKPVAKYYKAFINEKTGVMMISNPVGQGTVEIDPEEVIDMSGYNTIMNLPCKFTLSYSALQNKTLSKDNMETLLGAWIKNTLVSEFKTPFGKIKMSTANIIDAYKSMILDDESDFFLKDQEFTNLDVFEAIAHTIANDNKDFINKYEKTFLIHNII